MGIEFLETGRLRVYRSDDAEELKSIKRGAWTLEQVKMEADRLGRSMELARTRSTLPRLPDEAAANALLLELHKKLLGIPV